MAWRLQCGWSIDGPIKGVWFVLRMDWTVGTLRDAYACMYVRVNVSECVCLYVCYMLRSSLCCAVCMCGMREIRERGADARRSSVQGRRKSKAYITNA